MLNTFMLNGDLLTGILYHNVTYRSIRMKKQPTYIRELLKNFNRKISPQIRGKENTLKG
jgi:hypothetical protein